MNEISVAIDDDGVEYTVFVCSCSCAAFVLVSRVSLNRACARLCGCGCGGMWSFFVCSCACTLRNPHKIQAVAQLHGLYDNNGYERAPFD